MPFVTSLWMDRRTRVDALTFARIASRLCARDEVVLDGIRFRVEEGEREEIVQLVCGRNLVKVPLPSSLIEIDLSQKRTRAE